MTMASLALRILTSFSLFPILIQALNVDPAVVIHAPAAALAKRVEDLQSFTGTLGGAAPAVTSTGDSERPYGVDGNTFTDFEDAAQRSCDEQFNSCQLLANTDRSVTFTLDECEVQLTSCKAVSTIQAIVNPTTTHATNAANADNDANDANDASDSNTANTASAVNDASTANTVNAAKDSNDASDGSTANASKAANSENSEDSATTRAPTSTTDSGAVIAQTTISYDSDYYLVCDL